MGLGLRVSGYGLRVMGLGVMGLGLWVYGFKVMGLGFWGQQVLGCRGAKLPDIPIPS